MSDEKIVNITFICDEENIKLLLVSLVSLLDNVNDLSTLNVNVLSKTSYTQENIDLIYNLKYKYNCDITLTKVEDISKDSCEEIAKIVASNLIEIDKCIYLDYNVIVQKDLTELFNIDLESCTIGGVFDVESKELSKGVLIIACEKIRISKSFEIKEIELKYNLRAAYFQGEKSFKFNQKVMIAEDLINSFDKKQLREAFRENVIFSYTDECNPLTTDNCSFIDVWYKYFILFVEIFEKIKNSKRTIKKDYNYNKNLSSEFYEQELKEWYTRLTGEYLDLENLNTFNEKLQWLKLYDSTQLKTKLSDKYLVRDWITEQIGEEYLIPLLGVWDSFDEIDFDKLPNQFALKTNHGSGWNYIVKDKSKFDKVDAKQKFDVWLNLNYAFISGFELHYMSIKPKIIAEQYIENVDNLYDYKFMCFNGKIGLIWVDSDRNNGHKRCCYDINWNKINVKVNNYETIKENLKRPINFDKMIEFSKKLSKEFACVRVDFYEIEDKLYFGEMTFTSGSGVQKIEPKEYGYILGDMLKLPNKSNFNNEINLFNPIDSPFYELWYKYYKLTQTENKDTKSNIINLDYINAEKPTEGSDFYETRKIFAQSFNPQKIIISIVTWNQLEKTKNCVESLLKYTSHIDFDLVFFDNNSTDNTIEYLKSVEHNNKTIFSSNKNMGIAFALNYLISTSKCEYYININNDCYVTENWLDNILACFKSDEKIAFVCPMSSNMSNFQNPMLKFNSLEQMHQQAQNFNKPDPTKWHERYRLIGAVTCYRKHIFDLIGIMDSGFVHNFSDDDISIRIGRSGYKQILAGDVFIHHDHDHSKQDQEKFAKALSEGRNNFIEKYKGIDAWVDLSNYEQQLINLGNYEKNNNNILGVDVKCGVPLIEIKNKLREKNNLNTKLTAFSTKFKYHIDLTFVCEDVKNVTCDRINFINEYYSKNSFDYIVLGEYLNSYSNPIDLMSNLIELLNDNGQFLFKIKNPFYAKTMIEQLDNNNSITIPSNNLIEEIKNNIKNLGCCYNVDNIKENITADVKANLKNALLNSNKIDNYNEDLYDISIKEFLFCVNYKNTIKLNDEKPKKYISTILNDENNFLHREIVFTTVDVIVCVHNALEDVRNCFKYLIENNTFGYRIIIVDDGSNTETKEFLLDFSKENEINLIRNETAKGYTISANQGLKSSNADYVILLNSDTIVTDSWVEKMLLLFTKHPKTGIAGPLSNATSWQTVPELTSNGEWKINELLDDINVEFMNRVVELSSENIYPIVSVVNGFCFMISRKLINSIGYLDEETFPRGYGEENDYCIRAGVAGFELRVSDNTYVYHTKSKSFGHSQRKALSQQATIKLESKHGKDVMDDLVSFMKNDSNFNIIREKIKKNLNKYNKQFSKLREKKIVFIFIGSGGNGGSNSIVQEVLGMNKLGFDVSMLNSKNFENEFYDTYPEAKHLVSFYNSNEEAMDMLSKFDIVIATYFTTVYLLKSTIDKYPSITPCYYTQDYEPYFFDKVKQETNFKYAYDSYEFIKNNNLFAKTDWIRNEITKNHNLKVQKVSPSLDTKFYNPFQITAKPIGKKIIISAMVRFNTAVRQPLDTLRILKKLKDKFKDKIDIYVFGSTEDDYQKFNINNNFSNNLGILKRWEVAKLLQYSDFFLDYSAYQGFGRTGLEGMALGCIPFLPEKGGVLEYAIDGFNSYLLDTSDFNKSFIKIRNVLNKKNEIEKLVPNVLETAQKYSINKAAWSELEYFSSFE